MKFEKMALIYQARWKKKKGKVTYIIENDYIQVSKINVKVSFDTLNLQVPFPNVITFNYF